MDSDYITTKDAATELGVTARRVVALIKAGRLRAKTVGVAPRVTHLIRRADLDAVRDRRPGRPSKAVAAETSSARKKQSKKGKVK
jgi:excisionase family DNA binding protein